MRRTLFAAVSIMCLLLATGCWDKAELTEYGFVQAVALDAAPEGKLAMATHFYRPTPNADEKGDSSTGKGVTIRTEADTLLEAERDISIHFGRKSKWDHMRIIIIGDKLARTSNVGDILDFFIRSHEPRETMFIVIAQGRASRFLESKPIIETTIGQQLRKMEEFTYEYAAKTIDVTLINLAIQFKSETGIVLLPYLFASNPSEEISVAGLALMKNGRMTGNLITPSDTEMLLMLLNQYKKGVLEFPCDGSATKDRKMESFEVTSLSTRLKPVVRGEALSVDVHTKIKGSIGELRCSTLKSEADGERFQSKVSEHVKTRMEAIVAKLQKQQIDALGIGNKIYGKHPQLWKAWKPTWDDRFARTGFHFEVEVDMLNTGSKSGIPFGKEDD